MGGREGGSSEPHETTLDRPLIAAVCILMDLPIYVNTICMGLPIVYFKESKVEFYK